MKYKTYAFWTSFSAAAVMLIGTLARAFGFESNDKLVSDIIMAICGILVVFGVVKMPSKPQVTVEEEIEDNEEKDADK